MVSVYNQKNESDVELLGYSQVSISSVLSGAGNKITHWARLMHETNASIGGNSQVTYLHAGAIQLQLEYTKESELNSLKESKLNAKERRKQPIATTLPSAPQVVATTQKKTNDGQAVEAKSRELGQAVEAKSRELAELMQNVENVRLQKQTLENGIKELEETKRQSVSLAQENAELKSRHEELSQEIAQLNSQIKEKAKELKDLSTAAPAAADPPKQKNAELNNVKPPALLGEVDGTSPQRFDGSVDNLIRGILDVFIERYHKKNSQSTSTNAAVILQPLVRALKGYVADKGKDEISRYDLEQVFADLLISLPTHDAEV
jgi:myosin heavy subunit